MNLHGQMMNLQAPDYTGLMAHADYAAKIGHRDARHAAAELALKADAEIEGLCAALKQINSWCCYASEENTDARLLALQQIGVLARGALQKADGQAKEGVEA
jgi:hypothetical protein